MNEQCPKCGASDCISNEEYKQHIKISGAGVMSVESKWVVRTCRYKQQVNALDKIIERSKHDNK